MDAHLAALEGGTHGDDLLLSAKRLAVEKLAGGTHG
jgi:hypothetical protein